MSSGHQIPLHPDLAKDLKGVPKDVQARILDALEFRLGQAPDLYGQRLRQSLHGYWKLRVGDYRIVYDIAGREVRA